MERRGIKDRYVLIGGDAMFFVADADHRNAGLRRNRSAEKPSSAGNSGEGGASWHAMQPASFRKPSSWRRR
ncbi:hypothetical protein SS05631_c08140 [Sinorhizobium sp. CCBAU 05631]|nr:hypothetical protein SS05631_c08140 [Sinorhizobium sp. CCBAU 05631]